ncbi:Uncharacterised protein [Serratia fonticola]|uniref:Uncharacterized protein n=1 Tax=Serratia fonticola TaxID=47917 RepID=A0A4U9U8M5_SERFO|nr:Uncharacterised protein [Serratia fonticola]
MAPLAPPRPNSLLQKIVAILSGEGLKRLNIVPSNLLNAVVCLAIGIYVLRVTQRWLSHELLQKPSVISVSAPRWLPCSATSVMYC